MSLLWRHSSRTSKYHLFVLLTFTSAVIVVFLNYSQLDITTEIYKVETPHTFVTKSNHSLGSTPRHTLDVMDRRIVILYQYNVMDNSVFYNVLEKHPQIVFVHLLPSTNTTILSEFVKRAYNCDTIFDSNSIHLKSISYREEAVVKPDIFQFCQASTNTRCKAALGLWPDLCTQNHIAITLEGHQGLNLKALLASSVLTNHYIRFIHVTGLLHSYWIRTFHNLKERVSGLLYDDKDSCDLIAFDNITYQSFVSSKLLRSAESFIRENYKQIPCIYSLDIKLFVRHPKRTTMDLFNYLDLYINQAMWDAIRENVIYNVDLVKLSYQTAC